MKTHCERCGSLLKPDQEARICGHECTFCSPVRDRNGERLPQLWRRISATKAPTLTLPRTRGREDLLTNEFYATCAG